MGVIQIRGYKAWTGQSSDCCMFKLFRTEREAQAGLKKMEKLKGNGKFGNQGVEELEVHECICGRLYTDDCMFCEEARYDASLERSKPHDEESD